MLVAVTFILLAVAVDATLALIPCLVFLAWMAWGRSRVVPGRLLRVEVTHDAEWLPSDLEWAMEWAAEEALRCSGCGLPRDVSMRKGGDSDFHAEPFQCHACNAKHDRMKDWKGDNQAAIYLAVTDTAVDAS